MSNNLLAVITGGKKGIGAALAQNFASHGVSVIVTSRHSEFILDQELSAEITEQQLDVTNIKSIEIFFNWLQKLHRPLHYLINNAGIGVFKPLQEIDITEWNSVIGTNLTGAFLCLKYAYPFLKSADTARVINIGSIAEKQGLENNAAYAASKLGVKALSSIINEEWRNDNIFCTHVVLGAVATEIWKTRNEFSLEDMLDTNQVAKIIVDAVMHSKNMRIDTLEIYPKKGIL